MRNKFVLSSELIRNMICCLLMTIFFFWGTLVLYNYRGLAVSMQYKPLIVLGFFASCLLIKGTINSVQHDTISKWFSILCISAIFADLLRGDYKDIIIVLAVLMSFSIGRSFAANNDLSYIYKYVSMAILISSLISIYAFSITAVNSQGLIYCFTGIVILNLLCIYKKNNIFIYFVTVAVFILILSATRSRTSLLSFLLVAIMTYRFLFLDKATTKTIAQFLFTIIILAVSSYYISSYFENLLLNKWDGYDDYSSGRLLIWQRTIQECSLFGKGIDFLGTRSFSGLIFDAHNTYLQMLGCYGVIVTAIMIVLSFIVLKTIYRSRYRVIHFNFFLSWFVIALFENLEIFTTRMLPSTMLLVLHLSFLSVESKYE